MDTPIIRIELQNIKESILHHFDLRNLDLSKQIREQMDAAIESFNFDQIVKTATHKAISTAIHKYFDYGEGSRIINKTVKGILDTAQNIGE